MKFKDMHDELTREYEPFDIEKARRWIAEAHEAARQIQRDEAAFVHPSEFYETFDGETLC